MTKCDFCTMSDPFGKCYWNLQSCREDDCEKAIKKMIKALSNMDDNKKKRK